jgi:tRNA U34 5-methylaminomethyl-2-thiouridine-forming methyltransferase MnmC
MKREVINTADGSKTIRLVDLDENYHSSHGALQEAEHVFIHNGILAFKDEKHLSIFEMGFGTGLNAFLTCLYSLQNDLKIDYDGIEAYPVSIEEINQLDYDSLKGNEYSSIFNKIHSTSWDEKNEINSNFALTKIENKIQNFSFQNEKYDIVYYDAFGPRAQEEMWSLEIFQKLYTSIKEGGFLVTYCAKGQVKRDLKTAGFNIEALPGPPGKREMTRAWKR